MEFKIDEGSSDIKFGSLNNSGCGELEDRNSLSKFIGRVGSQQEEKY